MKSASLRQLCIAKLLILQMGRVFKEHMEQKVVYISIVKNYSRNQGLSSDHVDDFKLPFDDTLNETKGGRDADAYYRCHHEIDSVIGHSLGGAVALSLENNINKKVNNPFGIIQSKTFGSPIVSGNIKSHFLFFKKTQLRTK